MISGEGDGQQAAAQEDVVTKEAVVTEDQQQADPAIEREAREMGWVPQERFKGPPEAWKPADEFVKRGKEILPIVAEQNKRLRGEIERINASHAEEIANLSRMSRAAITQMRAQIEARYEGAKLKAVEQGDAKSYANVEKAQKDALKKFDEEVADAKPKNDKAAPDTGASNLSKADQSAYQEWVRENPWFGSFDEKGQLRIDAKQRVLNAAANEAWDEVEEEMPGASMAQKLAEVRNRVEADFPARFGHKANGGGSRVESGSRVPGGGVQNGRLFDKLPAAAKAQADEFIKGDGLYLNKGEKVETHLAAARERYAKQYFEGVGGNG